jgi:hypothetical protein
MWLNSTSANSRSTRLDSISVYTDRRRANMCPPGPASAYSAASPSGDAKNPLGIANPPGREW